MEMCPCVPIPFLIYLSCFGDPGRVLGTAYSVTLSILVALCITLQMKTFVTCRHLQVMWGTTLDNIFLPCNLCQSLWEG